MRRAVNVQPISPSTPIKYFIQHISRRAFPTGRSPIRLGITEPITGDSANHGLPLDFNHSQTY